MYVMEFSAGQHIHSFSSKSLCHTEKLTKKPVSRKLFKDKLELKANTWLVKEKNHLITSLERAILYAEKGMISVSIEATKEIVDLLKEKEGKQVNNIA